MTCIKVYNIEQLHINYNNIKNKCYQIIKTLSDLKENNNPIDFLFTKFILDELINIINYLSINLPENDKSKFLLLSKDNLINIFLHIQNELNCNFKHKDCEINNYITKKLPINIYNIDICELKSISKKIEYLTNYFECESDNLNNGVITNKPILNTNLEYKCICFIERLVLPYIKNFISNIGECTIKYTSIKKVILLKNNLIFCIQKKKNSLKDLKFVFSNPKTINCINNKKHDSFGYNDIKTNVKEVYIPSTVDNKNIIQNKALNENIIKTPKNNYIVVLDILKKKINLLKHYFENNVIKNLIENKNECNSSVFYSIHNKIRKDFFSNINIDIIIKSNDIDNYIKESVNLNADFEHLINCLITNFEFLCNEKYTDILALINVLIEFYTLLIKVSLFIFIYKKQKYTKKLINNIKNFVVNTEKINKNKFSQNINNAITNLLIISSFCHLYLNVIIEFVHSENNDKELYISLLELYNSSKDHDKNYIFNNILNLNHNNRFQNNIFKLLYIDSSFLNYFKSNNKQDFTYKEFECNFTKIIKGFKKNKENYNNSIFKDAIIEDNDVKKENTKQTYNIFNINKIKYLFYIINSCINKKKSDLMTTYLVNLNIDYSKKENLLLETFMQYIKYIYLNLYSISSLCEIINKEVNYKEIINKYPIINHENLNFIDYIIKYIVITDIMEYSKINAYDKIKIVENFINQLFILKVILLNVFELKINLLDEIIYYKFNYRNYISVISKSYKEEHDINIFNQFSTFFCLKKFYEHINIQYINTNNTIYNNQSYNLNYIALLSSNFDIKFIENYFISLNKYFYFKDYTFIENFNILKLFDFFINKKKNIQFDFNLIINMINNNFDNVFYRIYNVSSMNISKYVVNVQNKYLYNKEKSNKNHLKVADNCLYKNQKKAFNKLSDLISKTIINYNKKNNILNILSNNINKYSTVNIFNNNSINDLNNKYIINNDNKIFINFKLYPFGSLTQYLANFDSDIDTYLEIYSEDDKYMTKIINILLENLEKENLFDNNDFNSNYKDIIVINKRLFTVKLNIENIKFDLNFIGGCGVLNSNYLLYKAYTCKGFAALALSVKEIIKKYNLKKLTNHKGERSEYFNNYVWNLLLIGYLQNVYFNSNKYKTIMFKSLNLNFNRTVYLKINNMSNSKLIKFCYTKRIPTMKFDFQQYTINDNFVNSLKIKNFINNSTNYKDNFENNEFIKDTLNKIEFKDLGNIIISFFNYIGFVFNPKYYMLDCSSFFQGFVCIKQALNYYKSNKSFKEFSYFDNVIKKQDLIYNNCFLIKDPFDCYYNPAKISKENYIKFIKKIQLLVFELKYNGKF